MNKNGFIDFLKHKKKSARTIKHYVDFVVQYEA